MKGHVIISHGLQSGPNATKASALAKVAEQLDWTHERPNYCDLDAVGQLGDVKARITRLRECALRVTGPLILAGSSMGAFISARVSLELPVIGLFLMAPPTHLEGYDFTLEAARVPTRIVHGWNDELIQADDVVRWAQFRRDHLVLVNDSHRLANHVAFCAEEFAHFLQSFT